MAGSAVQVRVTKERWKEVGTYSEAAAEAALEAVATQISRDISKKVRDMGLVLTGNYRNSWTVEMDRPLSRLAISKGAPYGIYLEMGHHTSPGNLFPLRSGNTIIGWRRVKDLRWIPPRPHVQPVADEWRGSKIASSFSAVYGRILSAGLS